MDTVKRTAQLLQNLLDVLDVGQFPGYAAPAVVESRNLVITMLKDLSNVQANGEHQPHVHSSQSATDQTGVGGS